MGFRVRNKYVLDKMMLQSVIYYPHTVKAAWTRWLLICCICCSDNSVEEAVNLYF